MNEYEQLERRIRRLEDTEAIKQLVARYGFAADDRDMEAIGAMFTKNGCFRSVNGQMEAHGIDQVIDMYHKRFKGMKHAFHVGHDHIINFETDSRATGIVASHAEVIRNDEPWVVALRYHDIYVREAGNWLFEERALAFYYYLRVADYLSVMPGLKRMRGMSEPLDADWPEKTDTFRRYQSES
jgi:ketosteroid isomerase-like protein